MDLNEYLKKRKLTNADIADAIGVSIATIMRFKNKEGSPSLLHALKIYSYSAGEISFEEMMGIEDLKKFKEWVDERRKIHYRKEVKNLLDSLLNKLYNENKMGGLDVQELHSALYEEYRKQEIQRDFIHFA